MGGLKTLPMFLHLLVISLPSFTVNEYVSPAFKPVRETKTSADYPFFEPKNSRDPSMSSGTKLEALTALFSGGIFTFE